MRLTRLLTCVVGAATMVSMLAGATLGAGQTASAAPSLSGGTWAVARPFPGFAASNATLAAIACPSVGDCVAAGYTSGTTTNAIVASESDGVWGSAQVIKGLGSLSGGQGGSLTNVACGAPGDCAATGWYLGTDGVGTAFYVSETAGVWGTAAAITSEAQRRHLQSGQRAIVRGCRLLRHRRGVYRPGIEQFPPSRQQSLHARRGQGHLGNPSAGSRRG